MHPVKLLFGTLLALLVSCSALAQQSDAQLKNADFSEGALDEAPSGWWALPPGAKAQVVADDASPTKRSARIGPAPDGQPVANLMQSIDARALRGKRIIVRADIRLAAHESATQLRTAKAQMWVRVDRENNRIGFFNNMDDRPIRGLRALRYQTYAISGVVDDDAERLNVGLMAFGETVAHVARFTIMTADANDDPNAPAAAATERGLDNLVALTRLYGYVRYFHPSDEAANVDWERFLAAAAERVEPATDAPQLAAALADLFRPIAPTIQVWAGDADAAPPAPPKPEARYTAWRHYGVDVTGNAPTNAIYHSKRVHSHAANPSDEIPEPGECVIKALGAGVTCRVPLTLPLDEDKTTLPRAEGDLLALNRPDWWSVNAKDRSARLAGVMVAWNVFQHFYPYFDTCDADWPAVLRSSLESAATDADEIAYLRTLQRLVAELDDGHGHATPINMGRPAPLNAVFDWVGDKLVVVKVGEGVTDMQPGDEVVAVAGVPTARWYEECRRRISAATEQWARWRACSDHTFFGWTNDPIEMTFRRDGKEFNATPPRIAGDMPLKEDRPADGSEVAPGIVYFNLDSAELKAWQDALPALDAAKGIVLDMRGYPGGAGTQMLRHLTDEVIMSAKWNIPQAIYPDREQVTLHESGRWRLPPAEPRLGDDGQKVVIITDGRAISYAESCMGIVEAYKLAEIVGGPTAGANGNVNPFGVCGGYYISWTGMKVIKHDDSPHHGVGIAPTIPVTRTIEGIAAGRDELLEAAIKAAQGAKQ